MFLCVTCNEQKVYLGIKSLLCSNVIFSSNLERDYFEELGADGRIILK